MNTTLGLCCRPPPGCCCACATLCALSDAAIADAAASVVPPSNMLRRFIAPASTLDLSAFGALDICYRPALTHSGKVNARSESVDDLLEFQTMRELPPLCLPSALHRNRQ